MLCATDLDSHLGMLVGLAAGQREGQPTGRPWRSGLLLGQVVRPMTQRDGCEVEMRETGSKLER